MKFFKRTVQYLLLVSSRLVLFIGGMAVTMSCQTIFHEEEIPQELQKYHPFSNGGEG